MDAFSYFPVHYRSDLLVFAEQDIPSSGPFWMLCGMTLGRVFEPGRPERYADPSGFLSVLYYLNLISQGVHTYFRADHGQWLALSEPFADVRGCPSHHGGVSKPGSIIHFAKSPDYVSGAEPICLEDELLRGYAMLFFQSYIPGVCAKAHFAALESKALAQHLLRDPGCPEFAVYYADLPFR